MSGHGFHAHGPHDHAVEHAGHSGDDFASRVAAMTAILATVGALLGYQGGATQNDAMMFKNEAAIKKTEASDQWNFYQAKSGKQNLAELAVELTEGDKRERYLKEIERYKQEKAEIMVKAKALDEASKAADKKSEESLHLHHRWAQSMTAIQVAISLAAITILARRRWLQNAAIGVAAIGLGLAGMALMHL